MDKPRRWTFEDEPRLDKAGTPWYACDPYPTWYRWEDKRLITTNQQQVFYDRLIDETDEEWIAPTPFPGWAD